MTLEEFNQLPDSAARAALTPCVNIAEWVEAMIQARPFASVDEAISAATTASHDWQPEAVSRALASHPRIGERMAGNSKEADLSRAEQASLGLGEQQTADALLQGNQQYEQRFGRVFLIRAKGRTPAEILEHLHRRQQNSDAQEWRESAEQLQQITVLRFKELVN